MKSQWGFPEHDVPFTKSVSLQIEADRLGLWALAALEFIVERACGQLGYLLFGGGAHWASNGLEYSTYKPCIALKT